MEFFAKIINVSQLLHAWKVSKYGIFSGPYFPALGLNTERYEVSLRIQPEREKYGPEKTPCLDTFQAVLTLSEKTKL